MFRNLETISKICLKNKPVFSGLNLKIDFSWSNSLGKIPKNMEKLMEII